MQIKLILQRTRTLFVKFVITIPNQSQFTPFRALSYVLDGEILIDPLLIHTEVKIASDSY